MPTGTWEAEGWGGIDPYGVNNNFHNSSRTRPPIPRDPLAIDLDGDGIETVGSAVNPILFDHNADGVRAGTGWVRPDDAWLAFDRNGNGLIDSGRELFGVDTLLSGMPGVDAVYATTGFQALGTLDANADNVFDASDAAFTQVRLWQDLNQDGVSQAGELFTLADRDIASISLAASSANINLGNGNTVSGTAVVTRTNGSTTLAETVGVAADTTAANLNLTNNPFNREFTTPVAPSAAAQALPEMGGSGWVRDLHEAMSLGTPQSDALVAKVQQLAAAPTRDAQMALLDDLLRLWAETNQSQSMGPVDDPHRRFVLAGDAATSAKLQRAIPILEVFNGMGVNDAGMQAPGTSTGGDGQQVLTYSLFANQAPTMLSAYDALKDSVYSALVLQTRLQPYLDSIDLVIDDNGVHVDTTALGALLETTRTADETKALGNLVDLNRYAESTLFAVNFNGMDRLGTWANALPAGSPNRTMLAALGVLTANVANGSSAAERYVGDASANTFDGAAGNDTLFGGAGDDTLRGGDGSNVIEGGAGSDTLIGGRDSNVYLFGRGDGQDTLLSDYGSRGTLRFRGGIAPGDIVLRGVSNTEIEISIAGTSDRISVPNFLTLSDPASPNNGLQRIEFDGGTAWDLNQMLTVLYRGTSDDDQLYGTNAGQRIDGAAGNDNLTGSAGDDTLSGGAGNDYLNGGSGQDTYLFGRGDGQDTIMGAVDTDVLRFGPGIAPSDVIVRSDVNGTIAFSIAGTTDVVRGGVNVDLMNPNGVRRAEFEDGTVWGVQDFIDRLRTGTDAADYMFGIGNDYMVGLGGDDTLIGSYGNDTLLGGDGNDDLRGSAGGAGGTDLLDGGAGNDSLTAFGTLLGGAGDDVLSGGNMMDGGAGNDTLYGSGSGITYLFGRGDGQDVIWANGGFTPTTNTLRFKAGVVPGDLTFQRTNAGGNLGLTITIAGTTDSVYVTSFFSGNDPLRPENPLQRLEFSDGTVWDIANIMQAMLTGTSANDLLLGTALSELLSGQGGDDILQGADGDDTLLGGTGNDSLDGGAGNDLLQGDDGNDQLNGFLGDDTLLGGAGNDNLAGSFGNDTLAGGTGNDILDGGEGTNVFRFQRGDGQDSISSNSGTNPGLGTLEFGADIAPSQVVVARVGADLKLSIVGSTDQVLVSNFFYQNDPLNFYNQVRQVRFVDGTVWDTNAIIAAASSGTPGNDILLGNASDNVIDGLAGDDTIEGAGGNDLLRGGAGNDSLRGDSGNDLLEGGTGNDRLVGDDGDDVFVFNRGDGQDTLVGWEERVGRMDVLRLGAGIAPSDVLLTRFSTIGGPSDPLGNELRLVIAGGTDQIELGYYFGYERDDGTFKLPGVSYTNVQRIEFADGTQWDSEQTNAVRLQQATTTLNDTLGGTSWNETLLGGGGNDTLYGAGGNDTLVGGAGNDVVDGGTGSNTYLFGLGDGNDQVMRSGTPQTGLESNVLVLGSAITPGDITLTGSLNRVDGAGTPARSLTLSIQGASDSVCVYQFFGDRDPWGSKNPIQSLRFADGTTWDVSRMVQESFKGSSNAEVTWGTVRADEVFGAAGADTLYGESGGDTLHGGSDADWLYGDGGADVLFGDDGNDVLFGDIGQSYLYGSDQGRVQGAPLNAAYTGGGSDALHGGAGDDVLRGEAGDDVLSGDSGNDTMTGGVGNDVYEFARGDGSDVIEYDFFQTAQEVNVIRFGPGITESEIVMRRVFDGSQGLNTALELSVVGTSDRITIQTFFVGGGGGVPRTIVPVSGVQFADGTQWTDLRAMAAAQFSGVDLYGTEAADSLTGTANDDRLFGLGGDDTLDGAAGDDQLTGGLGNDTYSLDSTGDVVVEAAGEGVDTVRSSVNWTLSTNLENLVLTGSTATNAIGNSVDNVLTGNDANNLLQGLGGNDTLDGGVGVDTLEGGAGNDTYIVDNSADVVTETTNAGTDTIRSTVSWSLGINVENLTLIGADAIDGIGNTLNNVLTGNAAANTLNGGTGNDTMLGGAGDDIYVVNVATDVVTENANEGIDTVQSGATWTLGNNVENLTLTGASAINGTGNALNNILTGNSAANVLSGGAGNDTYIVGTGDTVTEAANGGTDNVQSSVTWTLSAEVENLTLTGTSAINGTGNASANVITGNSAANTLNGAAGADTLIGGAGNDAYTVDNVGDVVTELLNEGTDLVNSGVTYTLSANVENLTLTGSSTINGTGNSLDNVLTGNSANNTLNGGAGNDTIDGGSGSDTMVGGAGNDSYVVNVSTDVVTELANEGADTVQSSITLTLGSNVENLTLTGPGTINGTGNTLDNVLTGNSANNTLTGNGGNDWLDGGAGTDTMGGGTGNDTYVVERTADVVTENANEGTDSVRSSITLTLGANVENLTLIGSSAINGTGNTLDNMLVGNSAANTLSGGAGNDSYTGGAGADTLSDTWTSSNDIYVWGRGEAADTLTDAGGTDRLDILAGAAEDQIWLRQVGNNLELSVIGTSDRFTINGWYTSTANRVESFRLADGQTLVASGVQQLVDAMAAFAPPAAGQTTLPPDYRDALLPVIAPSWA